MKRLLYFLLMTNSLWLTACSVNKQIGKQAQEAIFSDSNFAPAHVGISIYDPSTNQYLYNYQGDKYFVPASNTKLLTCYAAMKHLGDSLVGLRYIEKETGIIIQGAGDPTLLLEEFQVHPVYHFFKHKKKPIEIDLGNWKAQQYGNGWAWNDFTESYSSQKSALPIYGNLMKFFIMDSTLQFVPYFLQDIGVRNKARKQHNNQLPYLHLSNLPQKFRVEKIRPLSSGFQIVESSLPFKETYLPREINDYENLAFLKDTLYGTRYGKDSVVINYYFDNNTFKNIIHSQPTDSLLKPMMHRSDNFFAEQSLLMVSNETLGYMNDAKIIDTLLKTDFSNMPQKPKWVDGSGLSRYNLITPQDFVWVLNKMKQDFRWERISTILPTGDEGTLKGYYKNYVGKIYAKTGTLSNNVSLSGFITTKTGKQLIFSVLVNNHQTSASNIRRSVEKFLSSIIENN